MENQNQIRDWKKKIKEIAKSKKFFLKSLEADEIERALHIFTDFCLYDLGRQPTVAEEMLLWKTIDSYLRSCREYPQYVEGKFGVVPAVNRELTERNREVIAFLRELKLTPLSQELPDQKFEIETAKKIIGEVLGKYDKKK